MAVIIPNVVNWSVTPQNGQEDYFTKMNIWLSESTNVIASLSTAITKINESNAESNDNLEEVLTARDQTVTARNEAVTAVATLTAGAIDDTTIAANKAFSNQFITNNYYNKTVVDNKININGFTDKSTPADTDHVGIQESGGLFKKLSFANLKNWILSLFNPTLTANATLTGIDNKIVMNGIVTSLGLEVGDVIQFTSVANANNQKMRTVESIINDNEIIVNYEHCGSRGNGTLKLTNETLTNATIKRIAKWYNAPLGLGQGWVLLSSARSNGVSYSNLTNRAIAVSVRLVTGGSTGALNTGGISVSSRYTAEVTVISSPLFMVVPLGLTYSQLGLGFDIWVELR